MRDLTPPSWRETVGRGDDRRTALAALRTGRGLMVTGPAGVGKSRFLDALAGELAQAGWDVVHVRATSSSRQVPLAVFAGLLSDLPPRSQPVELLHDILVALARRAAAGRLVLVVDDVQVLDDQSVTLVHQLATSHVAPVVLAYRSGEPVPGGIEALQRDDLLERMALQPLGTDASVALVSRLGGDAFSAAAVADICRSAEGVPLFLVTLARERLEARGAGRPAGHGPGLAAAVGVRLGRLDDDERRALETVALAEPLELAVVEQLAAADVLVRLEQRGLLRVDPSERRLSVRLGHPLFGEVLAADLPAIRRRTLLRELVSHRSALVPLRRRHDLLRSVLWQLDAGDEVDVDQLVGAASIAGSLGGAAVAERLARLAWERLPGDETACLYAVALLGVGRLADVDRFCEALPMPAADAHRVHVAVTWSIAAFAGLGDPARAMGVIERFRSSVAPEWRSELDPIDVMIRFYTGHVGDAAAAVGAALASPHPLPARARLLLLFPGVLALAAAGCTALAVELGAEAVATAPGLAGEVALASTQAACVWAYGLYLNGQTDACVEAMEERQERARSEMDVVAELIFSVTRGLGLWQQGRLVDAAAAMDRLQPSPDLFSLNWLPFARTWSAQCLARAGRPDEALALLGAAGAVGGPQAMHRAVAEAALAEVDVSHGERAAAAERLDRVAADAQALGQLAVALPARLRALALEPTDERADAALAVAERHDGLVAAGAAALARGWLRRDLEAVTSASARADGGHLGLVAFDGWELALELAHEVGAPAAEVARVEQHLAACRRLAGMATDGRPAVPVGAALTDREREVADLAVQGKADKAIARELGVSVRTVHAHLRAVYQKLGVGGRSELADHLWAEPAE